MRWFTLRHFTTFFKIDHASNYVHFWTQVDFAFLFYLVKQLGPETIILFETISCSSFISIYLFVLLYLTRPVIQIFLPEALLKKTI